MLTFVTPVPGQDPLMADSLAAFAYAFLQIASWPVSNVVLGAVILSAPVQAKRWKIEVSQCLIRHDERRYRDRWRIEALCRAPGYAVYVLSSASRRLKSRSKIANPV